MDVEEEMNSDAEDMEDEQADSDGPRVDPDNEPMQFDITIAASHSYMGDALSEVRGRTVLEDGWTGRVPALVHTSTVFPGETVPLLLSDPHEAALLSRAISTDKLFGLLFLDESGRRLCGWGVVCEVFEAVVGARGVQVKARVLRRARAVGATGAGDARAAPRLMRVAGDVAPRADPRLPAVATPWPRFLYDMFDFRRLRSIIHAYFASLGLGRMVPSEAVPLSFWAASNLAASPRDRRALFTVDCALLRLHMECNLIRKAAAAWLSCAACGADIARRDDAFAMSSEGVHANYTNPGGFVHDVVTVREARGVACEGPPSAEYSWFPGYEWRVGACAACSAHVGWRFTAVRGALRPRSFYSLCRNYVTPRDPPAPPL